MQKGTITRTGNIRVWQSAESAPPPQAQRDAQAVERAHVFANFGKRPGEIPMGTPRPPEKG